MFDPATFDRSQGKRVRGQYRQAGICTCGIALLDVPLGTEYTLYLWTLRVGTFQCGSCGLAQDVNTLIAERPGAPAGYLPLACFFEELPR